MKQISRERQNAGWVTRGVPKSSVVWWKISARSAYARGARYIVVTIKNWPGCIRNVTSSHCMNWGWYRNDEWKNFLLVLMSYNKYRRAIIDLQVYWKGGRGKPDFIEWNKADFRGWSMVILNLIDTLNFYFQLVSPAVFEKHQAKSLKEVQATSKNSFHCKTPDCNGWTFISDNVNSFKCPLCKRLNCITCQVKLIKLSSA